MKRLFFMIGFAAMIAGTASCGSKNKTKNSALTAKDTLEWAGVYVGITPCADCRGIRTALTLNRTDSAYTLETLYLDRSDSVFKTTGTFTWNKAGNTVILDNGKENGFNTQFIVGNNSLTQLDKDGNVISGEFAAQYVLHKIDQNLVDRYWKLTEINGKAVTDNPKESFITFSGVENSVHGNSGCNNFHGSYETGAGNSLKFSAMASTKMMCIKESTEKEVLELFRAEVSYEVTADALIIKKAEKVAARFVLSAPKKEESTGITPVK
ncbi:MAG: copper resistance protein NlpE N-terminal domain-containing protein [Prevotellaceae bacterium]|nr:copper resistance protein NlpE N-terminal domain-containing protein [Prevotellaceae bacterium]